MGVKNINLWNMACIAKLIWAIAKKKDCVWVQWIHGRYLKGKDIWEYTPRGDISWYWKKRQKVKDRFKTFPEGDYKVKVGYFWLIQQDYKPPWTKIVWSRISLPRHSFTAWLLMHNILPVLQRIRRSLHLPSYDCTICHQAEETH